MTGPELTLLERTERLSTVLVGHSLCSTTSWEFAMAATRAALEEAA